MKSRSRDKTRGGGKRSGMGAGSGRRQKREVALPPLFEGTAYETGDPELDRWANLLPLALACVVHFQKRDLHEKLTLLRLFREEATRTKAFFDGTVKRLGETVPAGDRISFVRDSAAWVDGVVAWTQGGLDTPPELTEWYTLGDQVDSLVGRFLVFHDIAHVQWSAQIERIYAQARKEFATYLGQSMGEDEERADDSRRRASHTHSDDFSSVNWYGTHYTFAKGNQAEAVRALWEAHTKGGHSLSQETIAEKIHSQANRFRLSSVFRRRKPDGGYVKHPAWGKMIQSEARGVYRLVPPQELT